MGIDSLQTETVKFSQVGLLALAVVVPSTTAFSFVSTDSHGGS